MTGYCKKCFNTVCTCDEDQSKLGKALSDLGAANQCVGAANQRIADLEMFTRPDRNAFVARSLNKSITASERGLMCRIEDMEQTITAQRRRIYELEVTKSQITKRAESAEIKNLKLLTAIKGWRDEYLREHADGVTDCVTPFDEALYGDLTA